MVSDKIERFGHRRQECEWFRHTIVDLQMFTDCVLNTAGKIANGFGTPLHVDTQDWGAVSPASCWTLLNKLLRVILWYGYALVGKKWESLRPCLKVTIAVIQFRIQQAAPAENLRKAERFIQQAAGQADIIVFPEDFVTGPLNGDARMADFEGRYVQHFQQLARKYAIDIVPGSIIEGNQAENRLYNTTYYIDRQGEIRGRYCKVNLWHPERGYITPGNEHPVFDTDYGKVGLIICWDLIFPEVFRAMLQRGVELVFCPSYWCFEDAGIGLKHDLNSEVQLVNALCTARAFENEIAVIYANAADDEGSPERHERLIGRSQIAVPFKGPIHRLDHTHEELFIQTFDTAILKDAESAYTIRRDLLQSNEFSSYNSYDIS
jgi:predicted amidohydrolase